MAANDDTEMVNRVAMLERDENRQDGSHEHPFIVLVDFESPNSIQGFDITIVKDVRFGDSLYDVLHIHRVTTPGMENDWSAYVPIMEVPNLAHRAIMVRGPSQDMWHRNPDLYCEGLDEDTVHALRVQQVAINADPDRLWSYWLIVAPDFIRLDNFVISAERVNITKGMEFLTTQVDLDDDNDRLELHGVGVYWRIALGGGRRVIRALRGGRVFRARDD